ncbi:MAG: energy-coupling factor transporter transmembrane protein EcfT [Deltaproteobacteria bacterium]|nr:energy-coupling factor transporter transmembrane protein EcfT [Deltaproteobacteria bacterium]
MPLFLYIERRSLLHRLHPTVKVFSMACFFVAAFVSEQPAASLPLALGIAALIHSAGAWPNVRRLRIIFMLVFVMTFAVWTLFYRGGEPWVRFGPAAISPTSMRFALGMAFKLVTFLGVGVVFLSTTKIEEFAYALTRVGMPYKLGFTMTLAFRLVPVFIDAAATVVQAQRCRGFDFDQGNLLQRMRRYVPVIVPVFMGALRRADGMAMALEARGFQSPKPRTTFERYEFTWRDAAVMASSLSVAALYLWLWQAGWTRVG